MRNYSSYHRYENRIFVDGKTLNQIAKESGIALGTVQHRYSRGITDYEGLTSPTKYQRASFKKPMRIRGAGDRLMSVIWNKDINITQMARETGVSRSTIYSFLYDNMDISSARLAKLCAWAGVSTDFVLGLSRNQSIGGHDGKTV